MSKDIKVGIADMNIARGDDILITYALGSCIGICLYDPGLKLAGMVHIMLPLAQEHEGGNMLKYADSGIFQLVRQMQSFGSHPSRMIAKIAGGAKMFELEGGDSGLGNIGARNAIEVKKILQNMKIRLIAADVGGTHARTMLMEAETGRVTIRSYGKETMTF